MLRERTISLTGFMGSGKSSVGRKLSALLSCPLVDLDSYIEKKESRTIPDIFATDGEAAFRAMELSALQNLLCACRSGQPDGQREMILSLGGGTLTTPRCADLVRSHTYCIYLRARIDTLVRNLRNDTAGRPMLSHAATHHSTHPGSCNYRSDSPVCKADSGCNPEQLRKTDYGCHSGQSEESVTHSLRQDYTAEESALRRRIETLMSARSHIYESVSSLIIDIDGKSFSAISAEIAGRLLLH